MATEKHNTVRFGENACFKGGIMINVPLLITMYLGRILKFFKRLVQGKIYQLFQAHQGS